jgi:ring-1,2-phenylacetyl-CoA epoxidase subunit PaaD
MHSVNTISREDILAILETVRDPEVPVLSVMDLGIVRDVQWVEDTTRKGLWKIIITPTYSGCPAMDMISTGIRMAMYAAGLEDFEIHTILSPAWTTDWMTDAGKEKLRVYGIAPPRPLPKIYRRGLFEDQEPETPRQRKGLFEDEEPVPCPRCGSEHTKLLSEFGSTACKALYQCQDCREPFDYFKCH